MNQDDNQTTQLGCLLLCVTLSITLSVPLLLYSWIFGSEFAGKLGAFLWLWPIGTLVLLKLSGLLVSLAVWLLDGDRDG